MKLNQADIGSPVWNKLVDHYTPLLATYRERLENPTCPETERIGLCWKIRMIKDLFSMAEPEKVKGGGA